MFQKRSRRCGINETKRTDRGPAFRSCFIVDDSSPSFRGKGVETTSVLGTAVRLITPNSNQAFATRLRRIPTILEPFFSLRWFNSYASAEMRSWTSTATLFLVTTVVYWSDAAFCNPIDSASTQGAIFVNDIKQCPVLKAKENARNIHDLCVLCLLIKASVMNGSLTSILYPQTSRRVLSGHGPWRLNHCGSLRSSLKDTRPR